MTDTEILAHHDNRSMSRANRRAWYAERAHDPMVVAALARYAVRIALTHALVETADDARFFARGWLGQLVGSGLTLPQALDEAVCLAARMITREVAA